MSYTFQFSSNPNGSSPSNQDSDPESASFFFALRELKRDLGDGRGSTLGEDLGGARRTLGSDLPPGFCKIDLANIIYVLRSQIPSVGCQAHPVLVFCSCFICIVYLNGLKGWFVWSVPVVNGFQQICWRPHFPGT